MVKRPNCFQAASEAPRLTEERVLLGIRAGENSRIQHAPDATGSDYATVDSVQPGYAVQRSAWVTPAFILVFAAMSAVAVSFESSIYQNYKQLLAGVYGTPAEITSGETIGLRPFFVILAVLIPVFSSLSAPQKLRLALRLLIPTVIAMALVDVLMFKVSGYLINGPFSIQGQVLAGIAALIALTAAILFSFNFPASNPVPTLRRRSPRFMIVFALMLAASIAVVVFSLSIGRSNIETLRDVGIIGGLGPGIALLAPVFNVIRYSTAWTMFRSKNAFRRWKSLGRTRNPQLQSWLDDVSAGRVTPPTVSFLVPAHNEGENIAQSVLSMDVAALHYPGVTRVVVVDNNSADQTFAAAELALRNCEFISGEVISCPEPGKSKALNMGLERIEAEVVVRVDADTVLERDCLSKIAMHFADPEIGGVGGVPMPLNKGGFFSRVREVEVVHNVAWNRLGQMAVDSVIVVPGMLSAFRSDLVRKLGGFVEGINGEDTDMTVRVGRSGYRIVVDPDIIFRTEVPDSIAHMREQRLRWSRSVFHVFTRNISGFWMRQGVRSMWMMPQAAFGFLRRALVPLLIVYALVAAVINPSLIDLRGGATLVAVLFGPELLITILAMLVHRKFSLLRSVPEYFLFRMFRAYIGLEVLLSFHHKVNDQTVTQKAAEREMARVAV